MISPLASHRVMTGAFEPWPRSPPEIGPAPGPMVWEAEILTEGEDWE